MNTLKADIHIHTSEDPKEKIHYSAKQLIEGAHKKGYEVLAITNHNSLTYSRELKNYAEKFEILLIPGVEATIEKKHVLLYNIDYSEKIKTFSDLKKIKTEESLIIAPHPFFPSPVALQGKLLKNKDLFDAVEYCHFYFSWLNFNHKGVQFAEYNNLPMVGTSDSHSWWQFHTTYSLVQAEKSIKGVIKAIKQGKVEIVSSPLTLWCIWKMGLKLPYYLALDLITYFEKTTPSWKK